MKRKLLSIVVVGALALSMLVGCGGGQGGDAPAPSAGGEAGGQQEQVVLGYSTASLAIEFCANMEAAVQEAAAAKGWKVVVADCDLDPATQVSQCEDLITQGVDALLIFPLAPEASATISAECAEAGIPLVTVESELESYDAAVLTDMYKVGEEQAKKALELVGDDIKPAILQGPTVQQTMINLMNGAVDTLKAAGVEPVDIQLCENQIDMAQQKVENWISAGTDFNCIIASSDGAAAGAINALEAADMLDDVVVISENGDTIGIELIQAGKLAATVNLPSANYGYIGCDVVEKILNGEEVDKITYLDISWIDASNVAEFVK